MKIGPIDPKANAAAATATSSASERKNAGAAGAKPAQAEPSARVQLSAASLQASTATNDTSFDQAKVDRISAAIREGRFQVDAGAIADKLIANAQELLGRARN